jgi:hypothetical protein
MASTAVSYNCASAARRQLCERGGPAGNRVTEPDLHLQKQVKPGLASIDSLGNRADITILINC